MANLHIYPSKLNGHIIVPSSKSHTLRAILFAALSFGTSRIEKPLDSPDTDAMILAVKQLGAKVTCFDGALEITGTKGKLQTPDDIISCGNSGQVLRFIGALAGLIPHYTILTGDRSIRYNRPVAPLLDGLTQLGAFAKSSRENGSAPILVKGPFTQNRAAIEGEDSQPVSGLLIASAFAPHPIDLHVKNPGETPWVELTLDWFRKLGISCRNSNYTDYHINGLSRIESFQYTVPGDFSSAAFPIAAAIITNSQLTIGNIDLNDIQGDKIVIKILQKMGAKMSFDEKNRTLVIEKGASLQGMKIDINNCIDALPILAVVGCFSHGKTEIFNGAIARKKESDRISAIAQELRKMGAQIDEKEDGLVIYPSELVGATLETYNDHRLALSLSVAALASKGESLILNADCANKTYKSFFQDFSSLGAKIFSQS